MDLVRQSGLRHECGIFAAIGGANCTNDSTDIAQIICIGLQALQHRGQESCGVVTSALNDDFHIFKAMGLVRNTCTDDVLGKLKGSLGVGHTRYATSTRPSPVNCQPFVVHSMYGALALAHNGQLANSDQLRHLVLSRGVGLSTQTDSELLAQALCLIPPEGEVTAPDWPARIRHLMALTPISYSLVIMLRDHLYAVRDPYGNRPLALGRLPDGGWTVASESCALMDFVREIKPGEIIELRPNGCRTVSLVGRRRADELPAFCIFEYVYFAQPHSVFEGQEVYGVRVECGRQLAIEWPTVGADVVGSVPESGNAAAHGYARQSGVRFAELLTKNTYVGRTFIQSTDELRQKNVSLKFMPIATNVCGRNVVLIDDSIVRGNTVRPIVAMLRRAGAKQVHIRVASPPLRHPCFMGIHIPTKEELFANSKHCIDSTGASSVGADSLEYLSVEGLVAAVQKNIANDGNLVSGHCTGCLTGTYPSNVNLDW